MLIVIFIFSLGIIVDKLMLICFPVSLAFQMYFPFAVFN